MRALQPGDLPPHEALSSQQTDNTTMASTPAQLAESILAEAESFMTAYIPAEFKTKKAPQPSPPSTAKVEVLAKEIRGADIPPRGGSGSNNQAAPAVENWFARTSVHENSASKGTADWSEFVRGLCENHSVHEMEYTPDVFDAHEVLKWDRESLQGVKGWKDVGMAVYEMCHHIPPPLNNRVFSVLVVTAQSESSAATASVSAPPGASPSFLVVQIPVNLTAVDSALYSNGKHKTSGDSDKKKQTVQLGEYVSIERAEVVDGGKNVKWQMATASDAKGSLPMMVQKMAIPGAVVKDVGFFIDWTGKNRMGRA